MHYMIVNSCFSGERSTSGIDYYSRLHEQWHERVSGEPTTRVDFPGGSSRRVIKRLLADAVAEVCEASIVAEVPDSMGYGSLLPKGVKTHVRLHCALSIAKAVEGLSAPYLLKARERRAIVSADLVSSPSGLMLRKTAEYFGIPNLAETAMVFPNPPPVVAVSEPWTPRDIDLTIVGRNQELKVDANLPVCLNSLPVSLKIVLAGSGFESVVGEVARPIEAPGILNEEEKYALYRRSKVVWLPSRFESFSMVAAEALLSGARVVCGPSIGLLEWLDVAHPDRYISIVESSNLDKFAELLAELVTLPDHTQAADLCRTLSERYAQGIDRVTHAFQSSP